MAKKKPPQKKYPRVSFVDADGKKHYYDQVSPKFMAQILDDMGSRLLDLHSKGSNHISRKDNNQIFDIGFFLQEVAERIKTHYPSSDY